MSSTGGMGRGSDTRMYAPRSESSHMYSANEGEDKYNPVDPKFKEWENEKRLREDDEKSRLKNKLKHIKVLGHHGKEGAAVPDMTEEGQDDSDPRKDLDGELSRLTGPPGNRGHELDIAVGAKSGTGSTMGHQFMASEPMKDAWSSLLKAELEDLIAERDRLEQSGLSNEAREFDSVIQQLQRPDAMRDKLLDTTAIPSQLLLDPNLTEGDAQKLGESLLEEGRQSPDYMDMRSNPTEYDPEVRREYMGNVSRIHNRKPQIQESEELGQEMRRNLQARDPSKFFADQDYVQAGIPMLNAWSELLKAGSFFTNPIDDEEDEDANTYEGEYDDDEDDIIPAGDPIEQAKVADYTPSRPLAEVPNEELMNLVNTLLTQEGHVEYDDEALVIVNMILEEANQRASEESMVPPYPMDWQDVNTGEPMLDAWSELLKLETPKTMQARRKKEKRAEFRPSTGQFKTPPCGKGGGPGSTMRRFKARMRGIQSGKKTGLMKPHLAVEMSHRGIKTKQPMSKDPARYRAYMGQQEAKKILGGARTVWSPHARYAERSTRAGPTGGGQLTGLAPGQAGQMRQPSLRRMGMPKMSKPRMPRSPPQMGQMGMSPMGAMSAVPGLPSVPPVPTAPPDPSQIMMSEDKITQSELAKMNYSDLTELRILLRQIARAKMQEAKESKKKSGTVSATEGAMPTHPAGVSSENDDMDPDGPTENNEMKANRLGLDPAGFLVSRRGHMG